MLGQLSTVIVRSPSLLKGHGNHKRWRPTNPAPGADKVKAGGMRIVQKHPHNSDAKEEKDKDDQDWETSNPPKPTVFISGVIARGDKDFPPAAAQVAHQKPHPSVEKLPHPQHVKQHIHQPRKTLGVFSSLRCYTPVPVPSDFN
ncbi:death-associated protein 1 [Patagioenas fasciata monilis]|uniref:Death-associated protein 1 n=1 Tax=Patagioenas fasciata monilis TaxID=372326 RepID=A0A1V4JW89_PATFA|nr:death-associated protein 1 [Patagioenas fasciata monilis]